MTDGEIDWPAGYDRTPAEERGPYDGDFQLTRKESFESIVDELERWGATSVDIDTASTHYADRPNIPHQHDRPDDVGVVARFRHEDRRADEELALACDRWETQRENARAIALYARRMRLAEKCEIAAGQSTVATAALPGGDGGGPSPGSGGGATPVPPSGVEDPEDFLGVTEDADEDAVEAAARRLQRKHHPDTGEEPDREKFIKVTKAKEAIING